MKRWRQASIMLVIAAMAILVSMSLAQAKKPDNPGSGGDGGDSTAPSGIVYYYFDAELIAMDGDGANKTSLGLPIGDATPSLARHNGMRWFLHAYFDLNVTTEANTTVTLHSPPDGFFISQVRWLSDPLSGPDAAVSWWEYPGGDDANSVLMRAPVLYGVNGEITGLDLTAVESFSGLSWDYDWSPDGRAVAYRVDDQLWIYDALTDVHSLLPLTINNQPRWSPDGSRIAYGSRGDNWTSIETINLANLSIMTVAKARNHGINGKHIYRPVWSPDSEFIAYQHVDASGFDWYQDIIRRTADGKSPTNLTADITMSYIPWLDIVGWTLE